MSDLKAFLRCELVDPDRLREYPNLLREIEAMEEDWDARNRFIANHPVAIEALLWIHKRRPANQQALEYWLNTLFIEDIRSSPEYHLASAG